MIPVNVNVLFIATDGVTNEFPLTGEDGPLYFYSPSNIRASFLASPFTGFNQTLNYNDDFTISGDGRTGTGVLTTTAVDALPPGRLTIWRNTPLIQPELYLENDRFPAETHNNAQDRGRLIDQDNERDISLAFACPPYEEAPAPVPRKVHRLDRFAVFDIDTGDMIVTDFTVTDLLNWIAELQGGDGGGGGASGRSYRKFTSVDPGIVVSAMDNLGTIEVDMAGMVADRNVTFNPVGLEGVKVKIRRKDTTSNPHTITVNGSTDMQLGNDGWMRLESDGATINDDERG